MSQHRSGIPRPGPFRLTLVLLAVVPAALAYPWSSSRDRWVLGFAVFVLVVLMGWWRGLHFSTILRRRAAMLRPGRGAASDWRSGPDVRTTVLLHVESPAAGADALPLPLIAGYLNRYGLSADAVRITSCDTRSGAGVPARDTWIGLTFSAVANLAALQARSARIPLQQTAESAARRLGDELREIGWETTAAGPDTVPELFADGAREVWSGLTDDGGDHLAAYRVDVDDALADTLAGIWAAGVAETWTAVEFAGTAGHRTVAAACALRTEERPVTAGPLPGLNAENGNHRSALQALWPLSARRLEGHAEAPDNVTGTLRWPAGAPGPRSVSRHAAVS